MKIPFQIKPLWEAILGSQPRSVHNRTANPTRQADASSATKPVSWQLRYDGEKHCVAVYVHGTLSLRSIRRLAWEAMRVAEPHQACKFLIDCRDVQLSAAESELSHLAESIEYSARSVRSRVVIVLPWSIETAEGLLFLESAIQRRGFGIRAVRSIQSAQRILAESKI